MSVRDRHTRARRGLSAPRWRVSSGGCRKLHFHLVRPIARTAMMFVESSLLISIQWRFGIVRRRLLDGAPRQLDGNRGVWPADVRDPSRRDEYLVTEPPVAGIDD